MRAKRRLDASVASTAALATVVVSLTATTSPPMMMASAQPNPPDYQKMYREKNCKGPGKTPCTSDTDCVDPLGLFGGLATIPDGEGGAPIECGWSYCDEDKGVCYYGAWNTLCSQTFTACGDWDPNRDGADKGGFVKNDGKCNARVTAKGDSDGNLPPEVASVGVCNGYDNNECFYAWCPDDTLPTFPPTSSPKPTDKPTPQPTSAFSHPAYDRYKCPQNNKCATKEDCKDDGFMKGVKEECGTLECDKGVCRFGLWNSNCPGFVQCANTHALCYNGPQELDYLGSCSGYSNNECRYAWCPNVPAKTTTTTTTTPYVPGKDNRKPDFIVINGKAEVKVNGNIKLTAKGSFSGKTEDITTKATWTVLSDKAKFDFPGLLQAGDSDTGASGITVKAEMNGASGSYSVKILPKPTNPPLTGDPPVECDVHQFKMKVLVIYQSEQLDKVRGAEKAVPAIQRALGYIGVPYDLIRQNYIDRIEWIENGNSCTGNYQAVIVSDGGLKWQPKGFKDKNGVNLDQYAQWWGARIVNWFTWPSVHFGWSANPPAYGTASDFKCKLTQEGEKVFDYMNPSYTIKLQYVWNQVAQAPPQPDPYAKCLVTDPAGNCHVMIYTDPTTGVEQLTMTFGSNEYTRHNIVLSYGIVNWATKGQFVGFRRAYIRADMDDYFIDDDIFTPDTPCGTPTDSTGTKWRMAQEDLDAVVTWQKGLLEGPSMTNQVEIDMVYNAIGTNGLRFNPDSLTPRTFDTKPHGKRNEKFFRWISHGWDHLNEDNTEYRVAWEEVFHNQIVARPDEFDFTKFAFDAMVTGQVSGLKNPRFLRAAADLGIRYLVSDTSRPGENPGDNKGLYNWFEDRIFMIPRRPNNLFYNVALRDEWVHEYNCIFGTFWGRPLKLNEIIDFEAEMLVGYMLRGEKYPWMFHQANMRVYDVEGVGPKFLLEELFDTVFAKFASIYNIDITSPAMDDLGRDVISHNEIETHKVEAELAPGIGLLIKSERRTRTPLTGFDGEDNLEYNKQNQCYVTVEGGSAARKFVPSKVL
uniref:Agd3 deacetylase domain-containing protein n=1 Tax=Pseudictyota dubia TaxID=2749911 RepID=A0A7R9Z7U1_9STRA|mmetsp:Transcript_27249/g.50476  ORF Transcript_27249/g.50476 Transcript_27249/m.50476 type:complete len:1031 (+) Transcript_27249:584-3676(+)